MSSSIHRPHHLLLQISLLLTLLLLHPHAILSADPQKAGILLDYEQDWPPDQFPDLKEPMLITRKSQCHIRTYQKHYKSNLPEQDLSTIDYLQVTIFAPRHPGPTDPNAPDKGWGDETKEFVVGNKGVMRCDQGWALAGSRLPLAVHIECFRSRGADEQRAFLEMEYGGLRWWSGVRKGEKEDLGGKVWCEEGEWEKFASGGSEWTAIQARGIDCWFPCLTDSTKLEDVRVGSYQALEFDNTDKFIEEGCKEEEFENPDKTKERIMRCPWDNDD